MNSDKAYGLLSANNNNVHGHFWFGINNVDFGLSAAGRFRLYPAANPYSNEPSFVGTLPQMVAADYLIIMSSFRDPNNTNSNFKSNAVVKYVRNDNGNTTRQLYTTTSRTWDSNPSVTDTVPSQVYVSIGNSTTEAMEWDIHEIIITNEFIEHDSVKYQEIENSLMNKYYFS